MPETHDTRTPHARALEVSALLAAFAVGCVLGLRYPPVSLPRMAAELEVVRGSQTLTAVRPAITMENDAVLSAVLSAIRER